MNPKSVQLFVLSAVASISLVVWTKDALSDRLAMARTHAHFTDAIQTARKSIQQPNESAPSNTGEWIALFSQRSGMAPNGGPAYIVNKNGNKNTGAIGVSATNYGKEVHIMRPSFLDLKGKKAVISSTELSYETPTPS